MISVFYFLMTLLRGGLAALSTGCIKQYQKTAPKGHPAHFLYCMIMSVIAMCFFFCMAGLRLEISYATLLYSSITGILTAAIVISQIIAMRYIDLLAISFSASCGSMILPVLFSVLWLGEDVSTLFPISAICMAVATLLPMFTQKRQKEKSTLFGYIICVFLLFANGAYVILLKLYHIHPNATNDSTFCFLVNLVMFISSGIAFLFMCRKNTSPLIEIKKFTPKHIALIGGGGICSNSGALVSFLVMDGVSVALLTVLGTSLQILATSFLCFVVFRERALKKTDVLSIAFAIGAVIIGAI